LARLFQGKGTTVTELTSDEKDRLRAAEDRYLVAQKDYQPFTITEPLVEREVPTVRFEEMKKAEDEVQESAQALEDLRRQLGLLSE
jgi:hypothetical protein